MKSRFATTETPKVYFTWDGTPFEELGFHNLVTAFSYTTTVAKTSGSKKGKFFRGGTPKVGNSTITFSIPDEQVAQKINGMLLVRARPEIAFGVKLKYQEPRGGAGRGSYLDGGFWVGSMKVDSIRWSYTMGTTLQLTGKKNQVLGMVSRCKPRTWYKKAPSEILKDVLEPHGITFDENTQALIDEDVDVNTINLSSPSTESDWEFTQRLLAVLGISDWRIEERQGKRVDVTSQKDMGKPYTVDRVKSGQKTQLLREAMLAANQLELRISELAAFDKFDARSSRVPVNIGYAPGLTDEGVNYVDVIATSVTVEQTGFKSRPTLSVPTKRSTGESSGASLTKQAPVINRNQQASLRDTSIIVKKDSNEVVKKRVMTNREMGNRRFLVRDQEGLVPDAPEFTAIVKDPSDSCITVNPSRRLAALAKNHGLYPKLTVTISPGVPSLRGGDVAYLAGTVAHDGLYGVEESTLTFNANLGLSTRVTLKPIAKRGKKKKTKLPNLYPMVDWTKFVATVSTKDGQLKWVPVTSRIVNGEVKLITPEYNAMQTKNPDIDIHRDNLAKFKQAKVESGPVDNSSSLEPFGSPGGLYGMSNLDGIEPLGGEGTVGMRQFYLTNPDPNIQRRVQRAWEGVGGR